MRWWFSASDHDVKIVLIMKLRQNEEQIVLEKWVAVTAPPLRPGATMTRAATAAATLVQPYCD